MTSRRKIHNSTTSTVLSSPITQLIDPSVQTKKTPRKKVSLSVDDHALLLELQALCDSRGLKLKKRNVLGAGLRALKTLGPWSMPDAPQPDSSK